jgi:hypothetical protein
MTEHERAVKLALKTGDDLDTIFARILGSQVHPRGAILSAYRQARQALAGQPLTLAAVAQVLADLQGALQAATTGVQQAAALGVAQAAKELAIYGLTEATAAVTTAVERDAWLAVYAAQANQIRALTLNGDRALILGDKGRAGALTPAPMLREGARWLALTTQRGYSDAVATGLRRSGVEDEFQRQAVAAIDERTTDCCLRVNGQVVGMDEPFRLSGTPRYADTLMNPGFHDYCRTSVALVRKRDADDELSQRMRAAARDELRARGPDGENRQRISPATATSRR